MNRKEFLRKLLQKTQQSQEYYQSNLNPPSQLYSPQPIVKRFQVLQMGSCHIGAPTQVLQNPMCQKQKPYNRKILTVQRVKSAKKKQQNHKRNNDICHGITNQIQHYANKEKQSLHNLKVMQSPRAETKELKNQSHIEKQKFQNEQNRQQGRYKRSTLISKRSLTLSDSVNEVQTKERFSLEKAQQKVRHIYSQSNAVFNRNYSQKKAGMKNDSQTANKHIHNNRKLQNQTKILFRKQILKNYAKPYIPPPKISAKSYIIYEKYQDATLNPPFKIHASLNSKNSSQVASLTKIMTCLVAINICQKFQLQAKEEIIKIGKFESNIGGTSAKIQPGDLYTLEDLYYGLMLPSGNDASLAIAVWGGRVLIDRENLKNPNHIYIDKKYTKKQYYERFIREMNAKSRELGMTKTNYANSHGLINTLNRSCAFDIAHLSQHAMENRVFRQIVATKQYCKIINIELKNPVYEEKKRQKLEQHENEEEEEEESEQYSETQQVIQKPKRIKKRRKVLLINYQPQQPKYIQASRQISWENTHKLLWKKSGEYQGIKTGVTTAAGPCLSTLVKTQDDRQFYIVVLNCRKMMSRFKETETLKKWVYKQEGIKMKSKTTYSVSIKGNDSEYEQKSSSSQGQI